MPFPKPKTYELTGAGVAGGGVCAAAIPGILTGTLDLMVVIFAVASFSIGGAFVGHSMRKYAERRVAQKLLRQYLWDADCSLNSSPLEFVRLASQRVITGADGLGTGDWAVGLSDVAAVVAHALNPGDQRRDIVSDPADWTRYRAVAAWVIPLMNSCGISHDFKWPPENLSVIGQIIENTGEYENEREPIGRDQNPDFSAKKIGL